MITLVIFFAQILLWFEAVRNLLTSDLHKSSAALLGLTEEFYDYFQVRSRMGTSVVTSQ